MEIRLNIRLFLLNPIILSHNLSFVHLEFESLDKKFF